MLQRQVMHAIQKYFQAKNTRPSTLPTKTYGGAMVYTFK